MKLFPRIFYGWWVLLASSCVTALVGALNVYGIGLFIVPLTTEFGWTRAALSGAISLARLEGGMLGPIEGLLVDRLGPRRMMLIGLPIMGIGFILLGQLSVLSDLTGLDALAVFYLLYIGLVSLGGTLGTHTPTSTAVANWFIRRRGLALGIFSTGLAVGATVGAPILGQTIQHVGWRQAAVGAGLVVIAVGLPAALVVRHRPEQYGYLPDGDLPRSSGDQRNIYPSTDARPPYQEQEFSTRQALATKAFWILALTFTIRLMVTGAVVLHLAPLLQDMGMTTVEAAGMISALTTLSVLGRLGFGWLGDLWDKSYIYAGGFAALALSLVLLAFAREFWHILLFLVFYGPGYGGMAALMPALRADYFGRRAFATIGGAMGPVTTLGTITGPFFAGYVFDTTGSYRIAMLVFFAFSVVGLVLSFFLRPPRLRLATTDAAFLPGSASLSGAPERLQDFRPDRT